MLASVSVLMQRCDWGWLRERTIKLQCYIHNILVWFFLSSHPVDMVEYSKHINCHTALHCNGQLIQPEQRSDIASQTTQNAKCRTTSMGIHSCTLTYRCTQLMCRLLLCNFDSVLYTGFIFSIPLYWQGPTLWFYEEIWSYLLKQDLTENTLKTMQ